MSSVPNASALMKIGQLKKPYGIKGWLWVFSDTDDRTAIFDMQAVVDENCHWHETFDCKGLA